MLTRLRIKNLRSLRDSGDRGIRPLTFLVGPNSSGNRSVIDAILAVRQTVDSRDQTNPILIDGPYVNLGSYRELILGHNVKARLELAFSFSPIEPIKPPTLEGFTSPVIEEVAISASFGYNVRTRQTYPVSVSFKAGQRMKEDGRTTSWDMTWGKVRNLRGTYSHLIDFPLYLSAIQRGEEPDMQNAKWTSSPAIPGQFGTHECHRFTVER